MKTQPDILNCEDLTIGHGGKVIMQRISFSLPKGKVLAIAGPSGCGKSTLMRVLGGLDEPMGGRFSLMGTDLGQAEEPLKQAMMRRTGFLFQGAALFSSLTLIENVELPMLEFLTAPRREIRQLAEYKLSLVGLSDAIDKLPSEISGGMAKRAGIARAMALDPEVIFLDEPSAGLDPLSSRRLDELILRLREAFDTTIVLVSHEIPSILRVADFCAYLDPETRLMSAYEPPKSFLTNPKFTKPHAFFAHFNNP